ncbi:MAG: ferritin-like domain-containing protein [Deltaproteobacteria bacterium]|nr:ferritin-like domain-containing protein [Deltaproteobacteria bacterium]
MTHRRIQRVRLRLLVAAGVAFTSGRVISRAHAATDSGSSSDAGSSSYAGSSSGSSGATGDTGSSGGGGLDDSGTSTGTGSAGDTSSGSSGEAGSESGIDHSQFDCGGCYGRPFVANAEVCLATATPADGWSITRGASAALDELLADDRAALVAFWSEAALSEHSSIAGFHRFALDLLRHGAPASLIAAAGRAAQQELEHAQACFALASRYAGEPLGPTGLPIPDAAPVARTLAELAVNTVVEGCIGETLAAWLAHEIHHDARDPQVRDAMAKIAADETAHAELAWATLRWALAAGGAPVEHAVRSAFARARADGARGPRVGVVAHGLLPHHRVAAILRDGLAQLVEPCARAVLAA